MLKLGSKVQIRLKDTTYMLDMKKLRRKNMEQHKRLSPQPMLLSPNCVFYFFVHAHTMILLALSSIYLSFNYNNLVADIWTPNFNLVTTYMLDMKKLRRKNIEQHKRGKTLYVNLEYWEPLI